MIGFLNRACSDCPSCCLNCYEYEEYWAKSDSVKLILGGTLGLNALFVGYYLISWLMKVTKPSKRSLPPRNIGKEIATSPVRRNVYAIENVNNVLGEHQSENVQEEEMAPQKFRKTLKS